MRKQQNDYYCGPASLAFVLEKYGKRMTQDELAERLHTTKEKGTNNSDMIRVVKELGYNTKVYEGDDAREILNDLKKDLQSNRYSILDYLMGNNLATDGHYSVLTGMNDTLIRIWNPWTGGHENIEKSDFIKKWKDIGEKYHKDKYIHWALVIS